MKNFKFFFCMIIFLSCTRPASPQTGQLDTTFGQGGIVTTAIRTVGRSEAKAAAIQSDGKIVLAGDLWHGYYEIGLVRYNSSGDLDITFGTNGFVTTRIGISFVSVSSIAIQSDNRIIAAGYYSNDGNYDLVLIRYNTNGSLDSTFGTNGVVTNSVGSLHDYCGSLVIQNDGKIIVAGSSDNGNDYDFTLVRYDTSGNLDNTFGIGGIITTPIGTSDDYANSVAIQENQKIIVGGYYYNGIDFDFAIIRYNVNGFIDNTFGTNGIVTTSVGYSNDVARSLAIQNDGKIIAAGYSSGQIAIVRYNSTGSLDSTFGTNGILTTQVGDSIDFANSVAIQNDGKIVAAGESWNGSDFDFALIRYNNDGSLDNTFGTNGILTTQLKGDENVNSLVIQNDGKLLAAGYTNYEGNNQDFVLVRYNVGGDLDDTFASFGKVITPIGESRSSVTSIVIQSDGKIVAAGESDNGEDFDFAVARYNTDGSLDSTFGINGVLTTSIGTSDDYARSVAIQDDGKIVLAGYYWNGSNTDFALVRYTINGLLDSDFGINGIVTTPVGALNDIAHSLVIQNDGKIVVAGQSKKSIYNEFAIVRYDSTGSLDNTFGTNGILTTSIKAINDVATSIAVQNDGKLVAAGYSSNGDDFNFAIVRYKQNGDLDTTFGTFGIEVTPVGMQNDFANSVLIQDDSKIVVVGDSYNGSNNDFALVRLNENGDQDNTFGTNGIVTTSIGNTNTAVYSAAIQADDKIIVVGRSENPNFSEGVSKAHITMARYNTVGTLDNTFGTNGILINQIGTSNSSASSVAIQSDGKIVIGGSIASRTTDYWIFSLLRYLNTSVIPVELISFTASVSGNNVILNWYTSTELNNSGFEIQRTSINPFGDWETIGFISGQGTTTEPKNYSFTDKKIKRGAYSYRLKQIDLDGSFVYSNIVEVQIDIPFRFSLSQNYPNPFNPGTIIKYSIPSEGLVTLKVYNTIGEEVATLINEVKRVGNYELEFNASSMPSGVYFYRLQAADFVETKKMILLK
jgi:uncharacterized delta-60 repeat protein